jgi:hypothetical protein
MVPTDTPGDSWAWAAMEPEPTEHERALYDVFCQEYLVDLDVVRAASRCGFQAGFAADYGRMLYQKSYVQKKIAELQRSKLDEKDEREFDAINIRARLRSIINDQNQKASARVAAARELNAMHGLHHQEKAASDVGQRAGIVLLPSIANLSEWEAAATASQSALTEESRVT